MLFEQSHYRGRIANIDVVMFVIADVGDQVVARFFCGSFGTKELRAHVIVDPDDARAFACEMPYSFRPNQSRRTGNDDCAHHSPIIQVTSPADGLTRAAGNCWSPASTRSISWGLFAAPTRNKTCLARSMSGKVNVNRHAFNLGTKFAMTRRVTSSNAAVPGKSDAVWPSSPSPRRIKSC